MNPEKQPSSERSNIEAQAAAAERAEQLKDRLEKTGEHSPEQRTERVERARHEAKEVFAKEAGKEQHSGGEPTARAIRRVTAKEKKTTYKRTMKQIQSEMSPPARAFSKIIHTPVIEKASDAIGGTVARPNALLAGSMSAFILVTFVYLVARHYGYPLSGFETIAAFIFGWVLGITYDYLRAMWAGRKS